MPLSPLSSPPTFTFHRASLKALCNLQVDPAERFGREKRLLTVDLDIPADVLQRAGPPSLGLNHSLRREEAQGHLTLVKFQAAQVKACTVESLYRHVSHEHTCAISTQSMGSKCVTCTGEPSCISTSQGLCMTCTISPLQLQCRRRAFEAILPH